MVRNYIRKTDRGLTYSRAQLREAVGKVRSGELNGYEAAMRYNIPRTTLYDHVIGRSGKSHTLGKPPVLSNDIEKILAQHLKSLDDNGFYLGKKEVIDLVALFINTNNMKNPFKSGKPGDYWFMAFCKRHDFNPKPLQKELGVKEKVVIMVKEFYYLLEMRINELELADRPGQIWHIQEHSFNKGNRVSREDQLKDFTFVTACSAEGKKAPLLTVFKGEKSHDWMLGKHINVSHTRGICEEVFKDYFITVFLNYIDDTRPNLVLLEVLSPLVDIDLVGEATKAKVILVKCPRYLEGLDIPIAKTFKQRVPTAFKSANKEFSYVVANVFDGIQAPEIEDDFKNAGVHPFAKIPDSKFDDNQLRVYEEYKEFKERHLDSSELNDTEEVMVKEDMEFQENFMMEIDECSTSMSMTDDGESPSASSSQLLRHALIAVKKGLTVMEADANSSLNDPDREHPGDSGTETYATDENRLVAWVSDLNNAGFTITEENLAEAVHDLEMTPFEKTSVRHSYESFLSQHPELKDKLSQNLSPDKVTAASVRVWLICVKKYLKKKNLQGVLKFPRRIFTFGEVGFSLKPEAETIHEKDKAEDVTVLVTASADGSMQAPSVIFPFKLPNGVVSSIWTKADILNDHITDVFCPWLIEQNVSFPVILLMDRPTHINLSLSEFFKSKQIIPIALVNTEIHPLNPVFQSFKQYWKQNNSAMTKLNKDELAKELENYVNRDFSIEITDGFKACGICPFNPNIRYMNELDRRIEKRRMEDAKNRADDTVNLLEEVEKRMSKEVLEEFMKSGDSWKGDPMHASLFDFWKGIREECLKEHSQEIENTVSIDIDGDVFEIYIEDAAEHLRNF